LLRFTLPRLPTRKNRLAKALTIWDLRLIAKRRTPKGPFDYTDGSAESEVTLARARRSYLDLEFRPNILQNVKDVDTSCEIMGEKFAMPFGISPTGFTRMMHTEGEIAGARAAKNFGIPFTLSTLGTTTIEDVVKSSPGGVNWFQLYMWKDREESMKLVKRAQDAGVKHLMLTVDVPVAGARLRDARNGLTVPPRLTFKTLLDAAPRPEWWINFLTTPAITFASMNNWEGTVAELLDFMFDPTITFEDLEWIREQWAGKLSIKGIQTVEDAKTATKYGVDAIILSNHGGRQLDRAPVPLQMLAEVKKELKDDLEIHIDTGIMHGADVLAALALGADFAYIGRAYLYGLMAGGQEGVERALAIMQSEMVRTMKLLGVNSLKELEPKHVRLLQTHTGLGRLPEES
jgi:isopentenyl diphosphate isomerase/L-lactate dehydrogenase-like FMN-dependent dehydrogenase